MKSRRRGLTLIELMVVMAILGVLITIVATAAAGSLKQSRAKRRNAMAKVLKGGIDTYKTLYGRLPGAMESAAESGRDETFSGGAADAVFREVVKASRGTSGAPCLDMHVLFVAPSGTADSGKGYGVSFDEAVKKNPPPHRRRIGVDSMAFGYQDPSSGTFRRYTIKYIAASDHVRVGWYDGGSFKDF